MSDTLKSILATEYSTAFDELCKKSMIVGYYKYGSVRKNLNGGYEDVINSLEIRLKAYKETGNTEFLADIANFAMMEFMYPQHPKAHYKPTDSGESPGISGMSSKEIERFEEAEPNV